METLKELGRKCGTDKEYHEFAGQLILTYMKKVSNILGTRKLTF